MLKELRRLRRESHEWHRNRNDFNLELSNLISQYKGTYQEGLCEALRIFHKHFGNKAEGYIDDLPDNYGLGDLDYLPDNQGTYKLNLFKEEER